MQQAQTNQMNQKYPKREIFSKEEKKKMELLRRIEGLHTIKTLAKELGIAEQSALNLVTKLRKEHYVTVRGGGKKVRLYNISMRKQLPRVPGMYDIINKYSPMKIASSYDHQVHGKYGVEDALIDAIETKNFRIILASLRLFSHVKDWRKLNALAKKRDCVQQVGALYDVARTRLRIGRSMIKPVQKKIFWKRLSRLQKNNFPTIATKWRVYIPFNEKDLEEII